MEVGKVPEQAKSMMTVSTEGGHTPLATVQIRMLFPDTSPLTEAVGLFTLEKVMPAPGDVQVPVPVTGVLAARLAVETFTTWLGPALAVLGAGSTVTVVEVDVALQPLLAVTVTR